MASTPLSRLTGHLSEFLADALARKPFLALCLRMALWLSTFYVLDQFMMVVMRLPEAGYFKPSLILEIVDRLTIFGCAFLLIIGGLLLKYGQLLSKWQTLEHGTQLRLFITALSALVAWPLSTYGYNYYFDQGYYFDRLALVLLVLLVWFRPVFIFPFLMLAFTFLWQLGAPPLNNGSHFPHKLQILHVLNLFGAMFLLHTVTGSRRSEGFFFLTCCLVAAAYWQPAMTKLSLGWITHGQLFNMPLAAYAHGWLNFLDRQIIIDLADLLRIIDWPMRFFVLAIEVGCLFILWRRQGAMLLLTCLMIFHLAVFALYGYLFWTWIALNAGLLAILYRDRHQDTISIFTTGHLALSVLLIYLAPYWCSPPTLGWFDTRLSYTYRYEAIGESGATYSVPTTFFAPYGDVFTMANFSYLSKEHKILVAPYGITGVRERAEALMVATTPNAVFDLETRMGAERYSDKRADTFYNFIDIYMTNFNRGYREPAFMRYLRAPTQFWSFSVEDAYAGQEPVQAITVREVTTLFDDTDLIEIRTLDLKRIVLKP